MRAPQRSLKNWGKQKWRTKSGKKSEYAATTAAKRRDKKRGKQFSKQPKKIAAKTRRFR